MLKDVLVDTARALDHETLHLIARSAAKFEKVDPPSAAYLKGRLDELLAPARDRLESAKVGAAALPTLLRILQESGAAEISQAFEWLPRWEEPCTLIAFDIDETLRAQRTSNNELPPATLGAFKLLFADFPDLRFVVETNHTLDDAKGFLFEGFGEERFGSGRFAVIYEQGAGLYTPQLGAATKISLIPPRTAPSRQLLEAVRIRIMESCNRDVDCSQFHLQGNEFSVTIKPNSLAETPEAESVVRTAGEVLLRVLAEVIAERYPEDPKALIAFLREFYAGQDPSMVNLLTGPSAKKLAHASEVGALAGALSFGYYPAEAVELTSREVTKLDGFKRARELFQQTSSPVVVLGDSSSDLPVMEHVVERSLGIVACPDTARDAVLSFVTKHNGVVFPKGRAEDLLHTVYAYNHLRRLLDDGHIAVPT